MGLNGASDPLVVFVGSNGASDPLFVFVGSNGTSDPLVAFVGSNGTSDPLVVFVGSNGASDPLVVFVGSNGASDPLVVFVGSMGLATHATRRLSIGSSCGSQSRHRALVLSMMCSSQRGTQIEPGIPEIAGMEIPMGGGGWGSYT